MGGSGTCNNVTCGAPFHGGSTTVDPQGGANPMPSAGDPFVRLDEDRTGTATAEYADATGSRIAIPMTSAAPASGR